MTSYRSAWVLKRDRATAGAGQVNQGAHSVSSGVGDLARCGSCHVSLPLYRCPHPRGAGCACQCRARALPGSGCPEAGGIVVWLPSGLVRAGRGDRQRRWRRRPSIVRDDAQLGSQRVAALPFVGTAGRSRRAVGSPGDRPRCRRLASRLRPGPRRRARRRRTRRRMPRACPGLLAPGRSPACLPVRTGGRPCWRGWLGRGGRCDWPRSMRRPDDPYLRRLAISLPPGQT